MVQWRKLHEADRKHVIDTLSTLHVDGLVEFLNSTQAYKQGDDDYTVYIQTAAGEQAQRGTFLQAVEWVLAE